MMFLECSTDIETMADSTLMLLGETSWWTRSSVERSCSTSSVKHNRKAMYKWSR